MPPDLHDIEWPIWEAFWDLSTDRQAGPIPWSSIQRISRRVHGIDPGVFSILIRAMDGVYLSHKGGGGKTFSRNMLKR